jgi:microcompartment protein CcmK/EutM
LKIARVVGNVVSTVKDEKFYGHKLMLIEFLDLSGAPIGAREIAFDCADSGPGDIVLVNVDGGAAKMFFHDNDLIADWTICGVVDHCAVDNAIVDFRSAPK